MSERLVRSACWYRLRWTRGGRWRTELESVRWRTDGGNGFGPAGRVSSLGSFVRVSLRFGRIPHRLCTVSSEKKSVTKPHD